MGVKRPKGDLAVTSASLGTLSDSRPREAAPPLHFGFGEFLKTL
jgi:hypothetical protein